MRKNKITIAPVLAHTPVDKSNDIIIHIPSKKQAIIPDDTVIHEKGTNAEMLALNQLYADKKYHECSSQAKALISKDPHCLGAKLMLARSALMLNQFDLTFAISLNLLIEEPKHPIVHHILSDAYKLNFDSEKAMHHAKYAYYYANDIYFFSILFVTYYELGYFNEALAAYHSIESQKQSTETSYNLAFCLLAKKEYALGWKHHESRLQMPNFDTDYTHSSMPYWDGKTDINGKKLLVIWEQGIGDCIQFIRFFPLLKQVTKATIYFYCSNNLKTLLTNELGIDGVITDKNPAIAHDYKVYLLSLPLLLSIYHEDQFMTKPYITANTELNMQWRKRLVSITSLRIGICWRGGHVYGLKKIRDCSLAKFLQLLIVPNCQFISLQKDNTEDEQEILQYASILNLNMDLTDLAVTAAVIANVDLVISVDTAIAHLAGAMGKPVWCLIRYETEWRHPRNSNTSPWYPSMRLFRQVKPGDWDSVFTLVTDALTAFSLPKEKPHE